ncbi:MAG: hypothetical protein ACR2L2_10585 [Acidobacteriota bacterium]
MPYAASREPYAASPLLCGRGSSRSYGGIRLTAYGIRFCGENNFSQYFVAAEHE